MHKQKETRAQQAINKNPTVKGHTYIVYHSTSEEVFLASSGGEFQSFAAWNLKLLLPNLILWALEFEAGFYTWTTRGLF